MALVILILNHRVFHFDCDPKVYIRPVIVLNKILSPEDAYVQSNSRAEFSVFLCMKLEVPDISEKLLYRSVENSSA